MCWGGSQLSDVWKPIAACGLGLLLGIPVPEGCQSKLGMRDEGSSCQHPGGCHWNLCPLGTTSCKFEAQSFFVPTWVPKT